MSLKSIIEQKHKDRKMFSWNGITFYIKDDFVKQEKSSETFNIHNALSTLDGKLPKHFFKNVETVYIGDFHFLNQKEVQAMYQDSSIYITNVQDSIEDFCDDLVHEIAHSVEESSKHLIYYDDKLENEFLEKRKRMFLLFKNKGYNPNLKDFLNIEYSEDLDNYLYNEVGYNAVDMLTSSTFYSPYAMTSLREYFANGFEAYFYFRDIEFIKNNCPQLLQKLEDLIHIEENY